MTNFTSRISRTNRSNAFMVFGLLLTLAVVMFRPGGATASLPESAIVFKQYNSSAGDFVKFSDVPETKGTYDIKFRGEKKTRPTELVGKSIVDLLKANGVDPETVPFVKIRIGAVNGGTANDGQIALIPLALDKPETPPMIISSWKGPNGPLPTPAIAPPQVDPNGISQSQIGPFDRHKQELTIIPAKTGAEIMGIQVKSKKTSKGQYRLSASVASNNGGHLQYQWFTQDKDGNYITVPQCAENKNTCTTDDATSGTRGHVINVVVTSQVTGSTGANSFAYQSKKADDGQKNEPFPEPTANTGPVIGPGTGTGTGTGTGSGLNGTITPSPGAYTPQNSTPSPPAITPTPTPTPATSQPTPSTSEPQTTSDTTGITNIAQNINSNGPLRSVTGVLLSSPTVPASGGGGGQAVTALPQPVATAATTIFKPVTSAEDLWAYMLAIMFAVCFSGAVREWVNP